MLAQSAKAGRNTRDTEKESMTMAFKKKCDRGGGENGNGSTPVMKKGTPK